MSGAHTVCERSPLPGQQTLTLQNCKVSQVRDSMQSHRWMN